MSFAPSLLLTFGSFVLLTISHRFIGHGGPGRPGVGGPLLQAFALVGAWGITLVGAFIIAFCLILNWSERNRDESHNAVAKTALGISCLLFAINLAHLAFKILGPDV